MRALIERLETLRAEARVGDEVRPPGVPGLESFARNQHARAQKALREIEAIRADLAWAADRLDGQ